MTLSRRSILGVAAATVLSRRARAAASKAKLRIGLLLPYSGTYAALGNNITDLALPIPLPGMLLTPIIIAEVIFFQ